MKFCPKIYLVQYYHNITIDWAKLKLNHCFCVVQIAQLKEVCVDPFGAKVCFRECTIWNTCRHWLAQSEKTFSQLKAQTA